MYRIHIRIASGNSLDYNSHNTQITVITYSEHRVAQERGIFALGDCDDRDGDHRHSLRQRHSHVLQTQHSLQFKT